VLAAHAAAGEAMQFVVDEGNQPVQGGLVTAKPRLQEFGDLLLGLRIHGMSSGISGGPSNVTATGPEM
jgi:hypothetical protein